MSSSTVAGHHASRDFGTITAAASALLFAVFISGCTPSSPAPAVPTAPAPALTSAALPSEGRVTILSSGNALPAGISDLPTDPGNNVGAAAYRSPTADNRFYLTTWGSPGAGCHPDARSYSVDPDGALTIVIHSSFDEEDPAQPGEIICPASIGPVTDLVQLPDSVTIPDEVTIHPNDGVFPDQAIPVRDGATG